MVYNNIVLIVSPEHYYLAKAFNRYANVFAYFIEPWSIMHVIHRVPGRIKTTLPKFPKTLIKSIAKIFNVPHKITISRINPESIDLVFVSDPIVCNLDLKMFKNALKAYWSHDSVYPSTYYTQTLGTNLHDYDIVFCAHKNSIKDFRRELGIKCYWLPFAYDPDILRPVNSSKKYDLVFVGTITTQRAKIITEIKKELPNLRMFIGNAWQHDMARIYNEAKIVLNISRVNELNWRIFEALGCRSFLLTNMSDEVKELFQNGKDLVMYENLDDLVNYINDYLIQSAKREKIARSGFRKVVQKHTIYHRAKEVLSACNLL